MPGYFQQRVADISVWFLRQRNIGTFLEAVACTLDAAGNGLVQGLNLSNPYKCPSSQLPVLSKDRKILLYDSEPDASKRWRLAHWRQLRRHFGSHYGEMLNVRPFFLGTSGNGVLPWIRIVHQSGGGSPVATWHTMAPDGSYTRSDPVSPSNWNWDNQPSKWSRWWAIIYLPVGYATSFDWNSGPTWDEGGTIIWDGVPTAFLDTIVFGLKEAKAAHSRLSGIIVTDLQPTDDIPGHSGVHPFDPASTAIVLSDGSTSLPTGNWGAPTYPSSSILFGLNTRPDWATFYALDNG